MPWMLLNLGGKYYKAKVAVELCAFDAAIGRIVAGNTVDSTADSAQGSLGTTLSGMALPVGLELFKSTPLEL